MNVKVLVLIESQYWFVLFLLGQACTVLKTSFQNLLLLTCFYFDSLLVEIMWSFLVLKFIRLSCLLCWICRKQSWQLCLKELWPMLSTRSFKMGQQLKSILLLCDPHYFIKAIRNFSCDITFYTLMQGSHNRGHTGPAKSMTFYRMILSFKW